MNKGPLAGIPTTNPSRSLARIPAHAAVFEILTYKRIRWNAYHYYQENFVQQTRCTPDSIPEYSDQTNCTTGGWVGP
eukprot:27049-Rhodomonas_salina.5